MDNLVDEKPQQLNNKNNAAARVQKQTAKMAVDLYYFPPSPPCRAVLLLGKMLEIDFNLKFINLFEQEHMTPEFLELNPMHTIPTMVDNDLILWESRAIMPYLVKQYGKNDDLYPDDPKSRAVIDQMMYFDQGVLMTRYLAYYVPTLFAGLPPDPDKLVPLTEATNWLNGFMGKSRFAAADHITLADLTLVPTIANLEALDFDLSPYENIEKWYKRTKAELMQYDYEEINQKGANMIGGVYKQKLAG